MYPGTGKFTIANPMVILREEFDHASILFNPDTGAMFGINRIGVLVWKHLDGRHDVDDLARIVSASVETAPPDVRSHIENFVHSAIELGLAGNIDE